MTLPPEVAQAKTVVVFVAHPNYQRVHFEIDSTFYYFSFIFPGAKKKLQK